MGVGLKPPSRRGRGELAGSPRGARGALGCSKCTTVVILSSGVLRVCNCPHFELPSQRPPLRCSKCIIVVTLSSPRRVDLKLPSRRVRGSSRGVRGAPRCSKCTIVVTLSSLMGLDLKPPSRRARGEPAGSPRSSEVLNMCKCLHFELSNGRES